MEEKKITYEEAQANLPIYDKPEVNRVIFQGYVIGNVFFKETEFTHVVNFNVCNRKQYRDKVIPTTFRVKCFNALADFVEKKIKSGMYVEINGALRVDVFTPEGGEVHVEHSILAHNIELAQSEALKYESV